MMLKGVRRRDKLLRQYLWISAVGFVCYVPTLFGTFVFDDQEAVVKNKNVNPSTPLFDIFRNDFWGTDITLDISHKSYRPLTVLTYRLNYIQANYKFDAFHFHVVNLVLYVILCTLSLPVYRAVLGTKQKVDESPFLCSILFAVHPVHTEVVASIVGRADILSSILLLVVFILYKRSIRRFSFLTLFYVSILVFSATLCKETAIAVLGICTMYDLFQKRWRQKPFWYRQAILAATAAVVLYVRLRIMNFQGPKFQKVDNPAAFADSYTTRFLTYNYVYFLNALLLFWPQWLCFDWSMGCIPLLESFSDPRAVFVVIFWMSAAFTGYCVLLKRSSSSTLVMAAVFVVFPFLPASNLLVTVGFVIAERILLLPSFGFCLLIVYGLNKLTKRFQSHKRILHTSFYVLCVVFTLRTIQRNLDWLTEEKLFNAALTVCPLNAKVHYNVAKVAADRSDDKLAIAEYKRAIELHPEYEQALNNLANLLREKSQFGEAEVLLRKALTIRPDFAAAWMNLGIVLSNLNRSGEAESCYLTAIVQRKKYPDCYYNLGNLYLDLQRNEEALEAWKKAAGFRPTHVAAWSNSMVLLDSLGRYDEALALGKEALKHNPYAAAVHFCLGNTLGKVDRMELAEKHFLEALNLSPRNALYYSNLGVLYHRWRKPERAIEMYRKALAINSNLKTAEINLRKFLRVPTE